MAQQLGFYEEECLTVSIRPGGPSITVEDEILGGRAHFGIHWAAQTLMALNQNKSVTIVAQIFQDVGMTMLSWTDSNIKQISDFAGKKVCVWMGGNEGNLRAALTKNNLTWDSDDAANKTIPAGNPVDIISQGFSMDQLLNRQCDVAAAETYNEYAQLLMSEKAPGQLVSPSEVNVMRYKQALLEDSIIVSTEWLEDPINQDITVRFLRASFKGWIWAKHNPEKAVGMFADKGPLQTWQLNEVNRLIWPSPLGIGIVENQTLQESANIAYQFNLTTRLWNVEEFYRPEYALAAHAGLDMDLKGTDYVPLQLAFCINNAGNPELCDLSAESSTSYVIASSAIGVIIIVVTILGLVFAFLCLALLMRWRGERVIKSASLPFSVLMCMGAIVGLFSNFFLLERPTDEICNARTWLTGLGFVTFIGNFLVKVWRIYIIFSTKVLLKINIPDLKLHIYSAILLVVQIILLSLYTGIGQPTVQRVVLLNQYSLYDTVCVTQKSEIWNILLLVYAALLLIYGVYLAVQVRNFVSLFNEAKLLAGSIYNMIFVAVVCGPILLFLDMPPTSAALIRTLAIFAMFTGSLAIVFIPKFLMVKSGADNQQASNNSKSSPGDTHFSSVTIDFESVKTQDTNTLVSQKEKAGALIKAIDAELERRSVTLSNVNSSPVSKTRSSLASIQ